MANKFKPGDLVELKSGGPVMTVERVTNIRSNETSYSCSWFAGAKDSHKIFTEAALKPADVD
jgi:uncharacterized protein YodC (DUF2158 family)